MRNAAQPQRAKGSAKRPGRLTFCCAWEGRREVGGEVSCPDGLKVLLVFEADRLALGGCVPRACSHSPGQGGRN